VYKSPLYEQSSRVTGTEKSAFQAKLGSFLSTTLQKKNEN